MYTQSSGNQNYVKKLFKFLVLLVLILNSGVNFANCSFLLTKNYETTSPVRLNDFNEYYGNVKLLRYSVPSDLLLTIWWFNLTVTESCSPTYAHIYLEYGSYPVISPHNASFPNHFNKGRLSRLYEKVLVGAGKHTVSMNVSGPLGGSWFAGAFIDTNDQRVKPDVLRPNCTFYLTTSYDYIQMNDSVVLYPNQTVSSSQHDVYKIYKYFSTPSYDNAITARLNFNVNKFSNGSYPTCTLTGLLRQSAYPDMNNFKKNNEYTICQSNSTNLPSNCKLRLEYPMPNTWHYIGLTSDCAYTILIESTLNCFYQSFNNSNQITLPELALFPKQKSSVLKQSPLEDKQECQKISPPIKTFRFKGPTYFSVKYYFNCNYNRSNAVLIQNDRKPYFIEFFVDTDNNGGTLSLELRNLLIQDPNARPTTATTSTTTTTTTKSSNSTLNTSNLFLNKNNNYLNLTSRFQRADLNLMETRQIVRVCLLYNSMSMYKRCPDGYELATQTYPNNIQTQLFLNVAYPMIGTWYLAIWRECFNAITNEPVACPLNYVPFTSVSLGSDQCANDYCGDFGTCYILNSNVNLFSACKCSGGYEGYGCTDSRNAISAKFYLASVLFLTLSNLVFLLPICLALYRRWYIEALMYFYNMFFSTFYHACDQDFFSFCIFNYDGLQLADFISSYSSFVITVLSMSNIVRPWKVFTFFVGLLACLSINLYDRFNYIAFIVYLSIAITITVCTWVRICLSKRKLYPDRKQLLKYYLPGFLLAVTGLLIYSFFQTKSNYWVLHSIWHMCMASSIIFFLPKRELTTFKSTSSGESLKDVTTTTSSLSESSGSNSSQSPQSLLHSNPTESTLLAQ